MSDSTASNAKKPLAVYAIIDRKDKSHWLKIGAAFTNRDGSITLVLDAVPLGSHRLQVREPRPFEDAGRPTNGRAAPAPESEARS
jgi:hypothetical protein